MMLRPKCPETILNNPVPLPTAGDNPDELPTATAAQGATPMAPNFQPWITRIDPNCGLLRSLRAVTTCAPLPPHSHSTVQQTDSLISWQKRQ